MFERKKPSLNLIAAFILAVAGVWYATPGYAGMGGGGALQCDLEADCDVAGIGDDGTCEQAAQDANDDPEDENEYKSCGACVWLCLWEPDGDEEDCCNYTDSWDQQTCIENFYSYWQCSDWILGECEVVEVSNECTISTGECWIGEPPEPEGGCGVY